MGKKKEKKTELDDMDKEEIARLISEGFTSGKLNDGEGNSIYWELKIKIWED